MASLLLIGAVFNLLVFLISLVYTKHWRAANVYFNLCLGMGFWSALIAWLNTSQLLVYLPHLFRTGFFAFYIFLGSSLLFSKRTLHKDAFSLTDLLFFIPALVFLVDYLPFYLQTATYKREIILQNLAHQSIYVFREGWLIPPHVHYPLRVTICFLTAIYQFFLVYDLWRGLSQAITNQNSALIKWCLTFSILSMMVAGLNFMLIFENSIPNTITLFDTIPTFLFLLFLPVSLLFNPEILYRSKGFWTEDNPEKPDQPTGPKVYFSVEKAEEMKEKLRTFMVGQKPFLNPGYSLNQLASDTDFPVRHVSALLNNFHEMSATDYINQYRVRYFIERYQNDPEAKKITFEALANECGFNTRYTFINAFKKQTGKTPSQYFEAIAA